MGPDRVADHAERHCSRTVSSLMQIMTLNHAVLTRSSYVSQEAFVEHLSTEYFLEMATALGTEDLLREPLTLEESAVARLAG